VRVYDPRLDTRPGAHACDPQHLSHVESRNPMLVALAFDLQGRHDFELPAEAWRAIINCADYCEEPVDSPTYKPNLTGAVTPPTNMMDAARASLSEAGFANLMARTGGRAPTPAELVEFADAERQAGVVPPYLIGTSAALALYEQDRANRAGAIETSAAQVSADIVGETRAN
jgi:hypothetical protein